VPNGRHLLPTSRAKYAEFPVIFPVSREVPPRLWPTDLSRANRRESQARRFRLRRAESVFNCRRLARSPRMMRTRKSQVDRARLTCSWPVSRGAKFPRRCLAIFKLCKTEITPGSVFASPLRNWQNEPNRADAIKSKIVYSLQREFAWQLVPPYPTASGINFPFLYSLLVGIRPNAERCLNCFADAAAVHKSGSPPREAARKTKRRAAPRSGPIEPRGRSGAIGEGRKCAPPT
jgi:hypothetical protein